MNKNINWEAVAQWRDVLRATKEKQCRDAWQKDGGFCCLTLLARDVMKIPKDHLPRSLGNLGLYDRELSHAEIGQFLKNQTLKKSNESKFFPRFDGELFSMINDDVELSFDEIADLLDIALLERDFIS